MGRERAHSALTTASYPIEKTKETRKDKLQELNHIEPRHSVQSGTLTLSNPMITLSRLVLIQNTSKYFHITSHDTKTRSKDISGANHSTVCSRTQQTTPTAITSLSQLEQDQSVQDYSIRFRTRLELETILLPLIDYSRARVIDLRSQEN